MIQRDYKKIGKKSSMVRVELIESRYSKCISVNEVRITNGKLYGYGHTVASCYVNKNRLIKLIEEKENVQICFVSNGWEGIWVDGVNISRKGRKCVYDEYLKCVAELQKKCRRRYSPRLLYKLREMNCWTVKAKNIKETLSYS